VLILQNLSADGPAYLRAWLDAQGVPCRVLDAEAGQDYPTTLDGYRALALLGGEMSANDELAPLRVAESLIRQALAADVPVIGHCLGGQLMARAMGARVHAARASEIGWHAVQVAPGAHAASWFGPERELTVFQWHRECFELPAGASSLASSAVCAHQAFGVGRHLAVQFHVELDASKLAVWSASTDPAYLALQRGSATVQSGPAMRAQASTALPAQQRLADRLYRRWLFGQ